MLRNSGFKNIYDYSKLNKFLNKKKKIQDILAFYSSFIKNYIKLNKKYKFSKHFNKKYLYNQIKDIYKNTDTKISDQLFLIPVGIKDNINTSILSTDFGLKKRKKFKSGNDARVVTNIKSNSGIVFSKLNCAEFAVHYIEKKKIRNPYNPKHIAGTSSTGSAVAVATGALPISIATQTAGSILRPSSYCGVYGFKPTWGSIDRTGILKTHDLFDTIGLIGNNLEIIKKFFINISTIKNTLDYPWVKKYDKINKELKKKKIKIGFFSEDSLFVKDKNPYLLNKYKKSLLKLKKKFLLSKIKNHKFYKNFHTNFYKSYHYSLYYYLKYLTKDFNIVSKSLNSLISEGKVLKKNEVFQSEMFIKKAKKNFEKNFENFDCFVIPTTSSHAPLIGDEEKKDTCLIWNCFGYPCINLPIYTFKKKNLPSGLMLVGKKFSDLWLIDFAKDIKKFL